jgi:ABC-type phosphate transport system auxiliary subunit
VMAACACAIAGRSRTASRTTSERLKNARMASPQPGGGNVKPSPIRPVNKGLDGQSPEYFALLQELGTQRGKPRAELVMLERATG